MSNYFSLIFLESVLFRFAVSVIESSLIALCVQCLPAIHHYHHPVAGPRDLGWAQHSVFSYSSITCLPVNKFSILLFVV